MLLKFKAFLFVFALLVVSVNGMAQQSDNGDGTYTNPVIWADFPDNDVIRVDDTYYMVTTSMYFFPGVPLMQSKDLVNWQYCSNAIDSFKQHPAYDMNGGTRYGRGQWASSLRYNNGKFHILFVTLDEGGFLCTAEKPEGPWKLQKLPKAYYDAGLFFDDNGKNYIVHGYSKLSVTEVNDSLAPIGRDSLIVEKVQRPGLEGSHVYKINGYYYIYATYGGGDGYQVCLRSKSIYGPYEEKVVLKDDMNLTGWGVHQGAIVQTQTGEWWSVIFQDRVGVGRVPTLQPVTWVDGWPMVGENGRAVVTHKKPNIGKVHPVAVLPTSDEFTAGQLGLQWAWNHNPDNNAWSLTERNGYLRLKTSANAEKLTLACNTLTQRMFGPASTATVMMDISHMMEGDLAGLGVLQLPYAYVAVSSDVSGKYIIMAKSDSLIKKIAIGKVSQVYLKAAASAIQDAAVFYYSLDNKHFIQLGDTLHMKFDLKMFTGNRFAVFNYATKNKDGYVDVDWFRMNTRKGAPNLFNAASRIEAEMYDEIHLAHVVKSKDRSAGITQDLDSIQDNASFTFNRVRFERNYRSVWLRVSSADACTVKLYLDDDKDHPQSFRISATDGKYVTLQFPINVAAGTHRLKFLFDDVKAGGRNTINWFSFSGKKSRDSLSWR